MSELVRNAVEFWLSRNGTDSKDIVSEDAPVYHCGDILVNSENLRSIAHDDRNDL